MKSLNRIFTIFSITFRESIRRRLVLIFVASCVLFSTAGACSAKLISMQLSSSENSTQKLPAKKEFMHDRREGYKRMGLKGKELEREMAEIEYRYDMAQKQNSPEAQIKAKKERGEISEMIVIAFCLSLFAGWSYLLAALFTPFIALNDLYTGAHVLLLASPLRRWEYLAGKFLAILAMVLSSLFLILITFHIGMYGLYGHSGLVIWDAVPLLIQGLSLFIFMTILFSFISGRMPAVILSFVILVISAIPAVPLISEMKMESSMGEMVKYSGYFIPQLGVNYFMALIYSIDSYSQATDLLGKLNLTITKIGSNFALYSILINTAWMVFFSALAGFLFHKKELNT